MSESAATPAPASASPRWAWRLNREEALAERAAAGDDRAFEALFERYHQPLYRYCRAMLADSEDAEDAIQATMVKALRSLPGEGREIALRPWLYRVAHNEAVSILRSRRETADLEPAGLAEPTTIEATVEMRDRVRALVADLATLPERQRASLVMRELNDLSYDDIGAALATSPAAARQAVYEARTALLEVAEGREMDCATAREAISAGDRRVLRGRKLRAHLRGCGRCRDFESAIGERRETLAALAPPLAAPAALALVQGALGGGAATGSAAAGTVGGGLAAGAAIKGAVAVLAVAAVGGGAAATGVLDRDRTDRHQQVPATPNETGPASAADGDQAPTGAPATTAAADRGDARSGNGGGEQGRGHGDGHGREGGGSQAQSPGNSGQAPGQTEAAPGQSGTAPGQAETTPGQSGTTPGQSGATPAQGAPPPGHSGTAPGQAHSNSGGGQPAAPGQTGISPGNSEDAPGHAAEVASTGSSGQGNATGHATAPGQNK